MFSSTVKRSVIAASMLAAASGASAAFIGLEDPIALQEDAAVAVTLVGGWAGAEGDLYFLGASRSGVLSAAADTAEPGLGQRLYGNKDAAGQTIQLGDFLAGDELHFAYHITSGNGGTVITGDVIRSDVSRDFIQFGFDADHTGDGRIRLGVEDIRDPKRSDWDYQDAVIDLSFTPARGVPAPGSATLMALGAALAAQRRRR